MKIFVISIITGYIAMNIAGALNANDTWVLIISFLGFVLPHSIVLERVYKDKIKLKL